MLREITDSLEFVNDQFLYYTKREVIRGNYEAVAHMAIIAERLEKLRKPVFDRIHAEEAREHFARENMRRMQEAAGSPHPEHRTLRPDPVDEHWFMRLFKIGAMPKPKGPPPSQRGK
jgi:hypothetical protein